MNAQELADAINQHIRERLSLYLTPAAWDNLHAQLTDTVQLDFVPRIAIQGTSFKPVEVSFVLPTGELMTLDVYGDWIEQSDKEVALKIGAMLKAAATPPPPPEPPRKTTYQRLQEENAALKARIAELEGKQ